MKNKIKYILGAVLALFLGYIIGWLTDPYRTPTEPNTIRITDTIRDWQEDTVYIQRYDTLTYCKTDTVVDYENGEIVLIQDTIQVPVPISHYVYDTTISKGDSVKIDLKADLEGFAVRVEQLTIDAEITPQKAVSVANKWYQRFVPAVGVGYGTSGFGVFVGVGYSL